MFGTAGDDELVRVFLGEPYGISQHVSPQAAGSTDEHGIVLSHLYAPKRDNIRLRAVQFIHGDEFVEYIVIYHQCHGGVMQVALQAEETFAGIVGFHVVHLVTRNQLLVLFTVRSEADASMEEYFQVRPYLIQMFGTGLFQNTLDDSQHPRRDS